MLLLYNNRVKAHFRDLILTPKVIVLLLLGAISLVLVASCSLVSFAPSKPSSPASKIIFVTVTPQPSLNLSEAARIRAGQAPLAGQPVAAKPGLKAPPAAYFADANELGQVLVLMYHRIGYPEMRYQRTPEGLRSDLQQLFDRGYFPVNFSDLVDGLPTLPPGKKPVVLTFDDSDISQFHVQGDNKIDADSAVGILLNFHFDHGDEWPPRATFFILGDDTQDYIKIFGQPEWVKAKLQFLTEIGMEVASHTVNHADLSVATAERIEWELAVSKHVIEELIPGYQVRTLSAPYGGFPYTNDFFISGRWGDYSYSYDGAVAAWGGPSLSPHHTAFDRYRVPRVEVSDLWIDHWLTYFEQTPEEYYTSDGDPSRVTAPEIRIAADQ
ncbi:MAG TPA: polysaccharide deacetylase family protein [Anaerolineae bacterium]|nr:polysaccharide deacetylase family protein [Anaerolineae bacterium]